MVNMMARPFWSERRQKRSSLAMSRTKCRRARSVAACPFTAYSSAGVPAVPVHLRVKYLNSIAVRAEGPMHRRSRYSLLPNNLCGTSSLECTSGINSHSTRAKLC